MLSFLKHNFDNMDGVSIYPIVALVTFFTVFVVMLFIVLKMKKKVIDEVSNLPLED